MTEELPKIEKGVNITLEGDRNPGEKSAPYLADIKMFSDRILKKMEARLNDMRDDDKQILEQKLQAIRFELMVVSDGLGELEE